MNQLLSHAGKYIKKNASTILTIAGGVGAVGTTVLAVKATPKAMELLKRAEEEKGEKLTKTEVVKTAAPVYVPTIITGVTTLACIFGANVLSTRQQATLMSAYVLLDNRYKDYRNKVKELYSEEEVEKIREELAMDRYKETKIHMSPDKELFYDEYLGEYFQSTKLDVLKAQHELNREIMMSGAVALAEYYHNLGIDYDDGGMIGWSIGGNHARYWQDWVDFYHKEVVMDDGLECTIVTMWQEPYEEYDEY